MKLRDKRYQRAKVSFGLHEQEEQTTQLHTNRAMLRLRRFGTTIGLASALLLLSLSACQASEERTPLPATATFAPCPDSPNCISSQADPSDDGHYMAPWSYTGSPAEAKEKLLAIINEQPRTTMVTDQEAYLHVEFRSLVFRFVDDVEFAIDERANLIHFRSASRLGYSDMGVNRKRLERIREQFMQ